MSLLKNILLFWHIKYKLFFSQKIKLIIGANNTRFKNWISTDINTLDITKPADWQKYFKSKQIDNILAEHVLEHLTYDEVLLVLIQAHKYLKKGGTFRIAVPDANHPSQYVIDLAKPGGLDFGSDDHKSFFSIDIIENFANKVGFKINRIEYFDNEGIFHSNNYNDINGYISRSSKHYKGRFTENMEEFNKMINTTPQQLRAQFFDKNISFTSLIVDLIK